MTSSSDAQIEIMLTSIAIDGIFMVAPFNGRGVQLWCKFELQGFMTVKFLGVSVLAPADRHGYLSRQFENYLSENATNVGLNICSYHRTSLEERGEIVIWFVLVVC